MIEILQSLKRSCYDYKNTSDTSSHYLYDLSACKIKGGEEEIRGFHSAPPEQQQAALCVRLRKTSSVEQRLSVFLVIEEQEESHPLTAGSRSVTAHLTATNSTV